MSRELGDVAGAAVYIVPVQPDALVSGRPVAQMGSEIVFKHPHVKLVSFAIEVAPAGITDVMVIETDLHLNCRHPAYDGRAVQQLVTAAQDYLAANAGRAAHIRVISNRSGEI